MPFIPFLFARGDNQEACAFNLSTSLGFSNGSDTFQRLSQSDPVTFRGLYQVVYVAPDLSTSDYGFLQQMVAPGGFIEQFVFLGGVAVINVAGTVGDQLSVAPDGVGFSSLTQHNGEQILALQHPYITGVGYGGESLSPSDFNNWQPTDLGTLTNLPVDASVLLSNSDGPSWAEYRHGFGRVIVTTLTYCWDGEPSSQLAAMRNLLRYSRFFMGSAFTPAPTVTPTGTPTPTRTRPPTRTETPTPSPTPVLRGDANGDGLVDITDLDALIEMIFGDVTPLPAADVNGDGDITPADIAALLALLGSA